MTIQQRINAGFPFLLVTLVGVFILFALVGCSSGNSASDSAGDNTPSLPAMLGDGPTTSDSGLSGVSEIAVLPPVVVGDAEASVVEFNRHIVELLAARREDLVSNSNPEFFNAVDGRFIHNNLSLMHRAAAGNTRYALYDHFWVTNRLFFDESLFNGLDSYHHFAKVGPLNNAGAMFVQRDHRFNLPFVDWVSGSVQPEIIPTDFASEFDTLQQTVLDEYGTGIYAPTADTEGLVPDVGLIRLVYLQAQSLINATLNHSQIHQQAGFFVVNDSYSTAVQLQTLTGEYQQHNTAEGVLTLVPIQHSNKLLAIAQPVRESYDYFIGELPGILADAMSHAASSVSVTLPLVERAYNRTDYKTLMESLGLTLPFSRHNADFRDLDAGGQYVSHVNHRSDVRIGQGGLELISNGYLTFALSPDNAFYDIGIDDGDRGIFGSDITASSAPACNKPDNFDEAPKLHPFVLAVVDEQSGLIDYIAEFKKMAGERIITEFCF